MSNFYDGFHTDDGAHVYGKSRYVGFDKKRVQAIRDVLKLCHKMPIDAKFGCLLDVGCGPGTTTSILAESFERSIGVDPSENLIRQARNIVSPHPITFKVGAAESLPVADRSVDVITVVFVLHFMQCDQFIAECTRVLKPSGIAVFHVVVLSKVLSTGRHENIPDAAPLIKEMNDKFIEIANKLHHLERHVLDGHAGPYNDIK